MKNPSLISLVLLPGLTIASLSNAASFQGLGDLQGGDFYSKASAISANGSVGVVVPIVATEDGAPDISITPVSSTQIKVTSHELTLGYAIDIYHWDRDASDWVRIYETDGDGHPILGIGLFGQKDMTVDLPETEVGGTFLVHYYAGWLYPEHERYAFSQYVGMENFMNVLSGPIGTILSELVAVEEGIPREFVEAMFTESQATTKAMQGDQAGAIEVVGKYIAKHGIIAVAQQAGISLNSTQTMALSGWLTACLMSPVVFDILDGQKVGYIQLVHVGPEGSPFWFASNERGGDYILADRPKDEIPTFMVGESIKFGYFVDNRTDVPLQNAYLSAVLYDERGNLVEVSSTQPGSTCFETYWFDDPQERSVIDLPPASVRWFVCTRRPYPFTISSLGHEYRAGYYRLESTLHADNPPGGIAGGAYLSESHWIRILDEIPPLTAHSLAAEARPEGILVTWRPPEHTRDILIYVVRRFRNSLRVGGADRVFTVDVPDSPERYQVLSFPFIIDKHAEANTHYYYDVQIIDWAGVISDWSPLLGPVIIGAGDSYEPDSTYPQANWIYSGSAQTHSISPADDVDWVKFSLSAESQVTLETSGSSGDTRMWLYDSGLNQMEYDDDGGSNFFSYIDRMCGTDALPPGTYYVKIDASDNNHEIPSYNINLTVTPCGGSNHDPQLSNPLVDPGSGYTSTDFYWYVHYYDEDGDSPSTKQVYIDGTAYTMSLHSGSDSNGTYEYGPKKLNTDPHDYYFYFTDGNGGSCRLPSSGTYPRPNVDTGGPVYFPDAALKAAVEKDLGISNPTPADMLDLVRLNAWKKGIVELTGLEYATNLRYASLSVNDISDISPLSGLTKLENLGLYDNQISDISAVSGLTNLIGLYLSDNQISDISSLSGLTNLTELDLADNQISDISSLSGLTNLTELYLYGNQISDISSLSGLTNLRELYLRDNPLNRAAYCTYLPLIIANYPTIKLDADPDPNPGAECPVSFPDYNLKTAIEEALGILDPMPADMLGLTYLDASSQGIADLTGLEYATNLMSLQLSYNQISIISPISGLTNLVELQLNSNQISDISVISGMTSLEQLFLSENQINDISALSVITTLTYLELGGNPLNIAAYCAYLPLIIDNNPGLTQLFYDSNSIDFPDFAIFALYWLQTDCGVCGGVDLTIDGNVDFYDLKKFFDNWLAGTIP